MCEKKIVIENIKNGYKVTEKIKKELVNSGQVIEFWVKSTILEFKTLKELADYLEKEV